MNFLQLLKAEGMRVNRMTILVMVLVSGASSAGVLAALNMGAKEISEGRPSHQILLAFLGCVLLGVLSNRYVNHTTNREVEKVVHRLRLRLIARVREAQLNNLEKMGTGTLFASISKDTQTLSQLASVLINAALSAMLIFFGSVYLAWLSPIVLAVGAVFVLLAAATFTMQSRAYFSLLHKSSLLEIALFNRVSDFIDGFKEIRMNRARSNELYTQFSEESVVTTDARVVALNKVGNLMVFTQTALFLLIGTMVFLVPMLSANLSGSVVQTATAVLFLFGPISSVVAAIPSFAAANNAANNIARLEASLSHGGVQEIEVGVAPALQFTRLDLMNVSYHHHDAEGGVSFVLGPIDFHLTRGEMVFITGGNGSGKTTFIKILTGLYESATGKTLVNGQAVTTEARQIYRELFSVVFNDPHLFHRLYSLSPKALERVPALLARLELTGKLTIQDGVFSTINLSTGQRKRLALLVALLEDKPIIILDEWAADQDPIFRKKFYRELLPEMKANGKTIVAITHDDAYFDVADRHIALDGGTISASVDHPHV
jgi:putative pyoverdin transport system ATP-binding/permease protein